MAKPSKNANEVGAYDFGTSKNLDLSDEQWNRIAIELGANDPTVRGKINLFRKWAQITQRAEEAFQVYGGTKYYALVVRIGRQAKKLAASIRELPMPPAGRAYQKKFASELDEWADRSNFKPLDKSKSTRDQFLDMLIGLWSESGHRIGTASGVDGGAGGPLVRFLIGGSERIFQLTPEAAREYVRGLKNPERKLRKRNSRVAVGRTPKKK
jgi:hypothetical protein